MQFFFSFFSSSYTQKYTVYISLCLLCQVNNVFIPNLQNLELFIQFIQFINKKCNRIELQLKKKYYVNNKVRGSQ